MTRKHCPDLNFPSCLCSTCRTVCSCLDKDRMTLPCPIQHCPGYRREESGEDTEQMNGR